jgi:membrane-bound lytic murein transglycosylase B
MIDRARIFAAGWLGLAATFAAGQLLAQTPFEQCVARLEILARERGISPATARDVLAEVKPLERVISADRSQPEFVQDFGDYLAARVTEQRVALGRTLLAENRQLLDDLTARTGVPGQYLVAFWGLETNYGRVLGNVPVFDSLTTLACDQRRADYFTGELINAMTIVDRGDVPAARMIGSWAGAMGQTQFMPSVYLQHAVDGDGDGRADLWMSTADALASAARFLESLGWARGYRWGREVMLPKDFDYALAGINRPQTVAQWGSLGVTDAAGRKLPAVDLQAALLVPAGSGGPAFLVYENFSVIMRWNRSEFFALAVGHLADRIAGAGGLVRPPPDAPRLAREDLSRIQAALNGDGFDAGPADGILGPATRNAIRDFQASRGLVADGYPSSELLQLLELE